MQTDAHMTFAQNWDSISVQMLNKAPSKKPVLSHYPPSHTVDLEKMDKKPGAYYIVCNRIETQCWAFLTVFSVGARLCGPVFANSDLETQIIRKCAEILIVWPK